MVVAPLAVAIRWGLVELLAAQATGVGMLLHGRAGTGGSAGRLTLAYLLAAALLAATAVAAVTAHHRPPTFLRRANPNAARSRSPRVDGVAPPGDSES